MNVHRTEEVRGLSPLGVQHPRPGKEEEPAKEMEKEQQGEMKRARQVWCPGSQGKQALQEAWLDQLC